MASAVEIYKETRKKHDLVFNVYVMRPMASVFVAFFARTSITPNQITLLNLFVFVVAIGMFIALPTFTGGVIAVAVLEFSYCLDCVDGMLARHKKIASKEGHLFDFFTDEIKAVMLAACLPIRFWRTGGIGFDATHWGPDDARFLLSGIAAAFVVASATSLTNFVRRPELSGKATSVEAHYEANPEAKATSAVGQVAGLAKTFLRFLNHYPSHIYIWVALGRLDLFFWMYLALNTLYLGQGWLGILLRFGRPSRPTQ
jgi:hypothetical protein